MSDYLKDGSLTVWMTRQGHSPITHQGSLRFVCIAAETTLRDAQRLGLRNINAVIPSDTLPEPRRLISEYLADVVKELERTPKPEPELGWKPKVQ